MSRQKLVAPPRSPSPDTAANGAAVVVHLLFLSEFRSARPAFRVVPFLDRQSLPETDKFGHEFEPRASRRSAMHALAHGLLTRLRPATPARWPDSFHRNLRPPHAEISAPADQGTASLRA